MFNKIKNESVKKHDTTTKEEVCKNCGRELKEFSGRYGKFKGCENFINDEKCKNSYNKNN